MYKKIINDRVTGQEAKIIFHVDTNRYVPFDPTNTDYQKYLEWLAEGNTPLPADEGNE